MTEIQKATEIQKNMEHKGKKKSLLKKNKLDLAARELVLLRHLTMDVGEFNIQQTKHKQ